MGPVNSDTWHLILDGAEKILREEGYAALTSRRVAERVSIRQQLVYYYFQTMDHLMVEAFRRLAKRDYERLAEINASAAPLRGLWELRSHEGDARVISEFMALAHRNAGVKNEVIKYIETNRRIQSGAIARAIEKRKAKAPIASMAPGTVDFLATSIALALTREAALGVTSAHRDVEKLVEACLAVFEPPVKKARSKRR